MEGRRGRGYSNYGRGGSAGRGRGSNQWDQSYQGFQYHQRGGGGGGRGRGTHHMGDGHDNRSPVEAVAAGGFGGGRGRGTHHIGGGHDNRSPLQAVAAGGFGGGRGGRGRGTHHMGGGHANRSPGQAVAAGGFVGGRGRGTNNGVGITLTGLPSLLLMVGWDPQQEEVFGSIGFSYPYSTTGQQMQQHPPQNPERPNQSSDPVQPNVETAEDVRNQVSTISETK